MCFIAGDDTSQSDKNSESTNSDNCGELVRRQQRPNEAAVPGTLIYLYCMTNTTVDCFLNAETSQASTFDDGSVGRDCCPEFPTNHEPDQYWSSSKPFWSQFTFNEHEWKGE